MRPHPLAGFFTVDPDAILGAQDRLAAEDEPARARVVRPGLAPFVAGLRAPPEGLWSEAYFGPEDARDPAAWGVALLPQAMLHPGLVPAIAAALGLRTTEVRAVAEMRAWIDAEGRIRTPPGHPGVDASLETTLVDWPPYPFDETLRRLEAACDPAYHERLATLYAELGIDAKAIAQDDKSWEAEAYANTGPNALQVALTARGGSEVAARLMVLRVPVPPVNERPLERRPGGVWVAGARSESITALLVATVRLGQLIQYEAPANVIAYHVLVVQRALAAMLAAWGSGEAPEPELAVSLACLAGDGPNDGPEWQLPASHADLAAPTGLAFVDARRAVLGTATTTFEIDLVTGAVRDWWRSAGMVIQTCFDGHVLYSGGWQYACFELARGRWRGGELPAWVPCVFEELQEVSFLIETATGRRHRLAALGDYPVELLVTPCLRYLAAHDKHGSGGVYRHDGEMQMPTYLRLGEPPVMWPEGQLRAPTEAEVRRLRDTAWAYAGLNALVLCEARDAWRRVQDQAVVEGTRALLGLPFAVTAAAFDRAGREVLVASQSELWHLALDPEPRLRARFDLQPLQAMLLGPPGRSRPRVDALNAALCRHGTLVAVAEADADELAQLNAASAFDHPRLLGRRRARRLVAHAQAAERARKLPRLWPRR
ncbi:hypothetical protein [Nannocystis radixulma]|uniref:Uncharacterized protein n=1 Tax=Nannocystis radixulma TaxID=2995305 RepID=A0ABT5BEX3_9BACT|nr:hypothetical protein [Nannocystis radixulma]MDC0672160.1 hypothetical protein [Nannocystis radixulma]